MSKIKLLPPKVSELIAAGEVVERPVSVVKELVENSLDAGAKRITVEIEGGGKKSIKITDDGCGMSPDDAETALKRFATSKISRLEDLDALDTLGFRGEALPSIASVSRFTLITRETDSMEGIKLVLGGGELREKTRLGCPAGTMIEVKELFFNTPARKKFLRSAGWETAKIVELIGRLALFYQGIDFHLIHNGKEVLAFPPQLDLKQKLGLILGVDEEQLLEFSYQSEKGRVVGLAGKPQVALHNREGQIVFLRGRLVKNPLIYQAVTVAYGEKLERGKHPVALLFLDLPGDTFDINVHPSKAEVRFASNQDVFSLINQGVKSAFAAYGEIVPAQAAGDTAPHVAESLRLELKPLAWEGEGRQTGVTPFLPALAESVSAVPEISTGSCEKLRPLGQIANTYLVIVQERELILIDQHAAAERITYEKLRRDSQTGKAALQELLFPEVVELPPALMELTEENLENFEALGLKAEIFGDNTVLVRSIPLALSRFAPGESFREVLEEVSREFPGGKLSKREQMLISMACKGSLKAGEPLSGGEILNLYRQLLETPNYTNCPHGRPTIIKMGEKDLEKVFKRV